MKIVPVLSARTPARWHSTEDYKTNAHTSLIFSSRHVATTRNSSRDRSVPDRPTN